MDTFAVTKLPGVTSERYIIHFLSTFTVIIKVKIKINKTLPELMIRK